MVESGGGQVVINPSDLLAGHELRGVRRRLGGGGAAAAGDAREEGHAGGAGNGGSDHGSGSYGAGGGKPSAYERQSAARVRCHPGLDVAATAVFLLQPLMALLLPPAAASGWLAAALIAPAAKIAAALGVLLLARRLLLFRRWRDEMALVPRFIACFAAMVAELAVENCVVWLVSAWDLRKYDNVPGLQDNVAIAVHALSARSRLVAAAAAAPWANILHFLGALLVLAFSVLWDQVPYSGFGVMSRVVLTVACSRVLRMASFMCTVLPNPRPGCYRRRFPPVPPGLWDTLRLGYTTIRGFGGCNDLIFSGHGAFWVLAPLAFRTYYPGRRLSTAVMWLALLHACIKDVVDEQHYSVDMLLAVVVTWAVWDWLAWVYPAEERLLPRRPPGAPPDRLNPAVLALILACLAIAGVIVIGGKA